MSSIYELASIYKTAVCSFASWSNQAAFPASAVQIAIFGSNVILVVVAVALRSAAG